MTQKVDQEQQDDLSHVMRIPDFRLCENKGADQLYSDCEADQHLCFRYTDSTIPLLSKSKKTVSSQLLCLYSSVCVRDGRKPDRSRLIFLANLENTIEVDGILRSDKYFCPPSVYQLKKEKFRVL